MKRGFLKGLDLERAQIDSIMAEYGKMVTFYKSRQKELQRRYDEDKRSFEAKLQEVQLVHALKLALKGKVHDAELVIDLIDKAKIELSDDGIISKGLDEQIKELQKSKSFLFVP